jgi:hypothetical protein
MNRRTFILWSAALMGAPRLALAQAITPLGAAQAAAGLYGAISERRFQDETLVRLEEISAALRSVNAKLDEVLDLLRALPAAWVAALDQSYRRQLADNILARESTIFSRVRAVQSVAQIPAEAHTALGALADQQATVRYQLSSLAAGSYPFVARAFASEAIALKAMRDQGSLFEIRQGEAVRHLEGVSEDFGRLVKAREEVLNQAKGLWQRTPRPFFIGMNGGTPAHGSSMYGVIYGSFETGVTNSRVAQGTGNAHNLYNVMNAGIHELAPPTHVPALQHAHARLAIVVEGLNKATAEGKAAAGHIQVLEQHQQAAALLAEAVRALKYR